MTGTARFAAALEVGIAASQQALHQVRRGAPRETGRSLHPAAFAAVCLGIRQAYRTEADLADLQPRIEKALRHLGESRDARPVVRPRRPFLAVLRHLGTGDPDERPGALQDSAALATASPGLARHRPDGARGRVSPATSSAAACARQGRGRC